VAEAEYFGLDSMLAQLRIQEDDEKKEKEKKLQKDHFPVKRVLVYSVRHLRVVECCTLHHGQSFCSKVSYVLIRFHLYCKLTTKESRTILDQNCRRSQKLLESSKILFKNI